MAWSDLKSWIKGMIIGFVFGIIIMILLMLPLGTVSDFLLKIFESQCKLFITCTTSPCRDCLPITYALIFLEPTLIGIIIGLFFKKKSSQQNASPYPVSNPQQQMPPMQTMQ